MTPAEKLAKETRRKPAKQKQAPRVPKWDCRLAQIRKDLGLSMRKTSQGIGLSLPNYHAIEHGCDPQLTTADRIAKFFGKPIAELWPNRLQGAKS